MTSLSISGTAFSGDEIDVLITAIDEIFGTPAIIDKMAVNFEYEAGAAVSVMGDTKEIVKQIGDATKRAFGTRKRIKSTLNLLRTKLYMIQQSMEKGKVDSEIKALLRQLEGGE